MKKILIFLAKLVISCLLITYILSKTDLRAIGATLIGANGWLLTLALLLHVVGFTISAVRWKLLLKIQGVEASTGRLFISYIVGNFFSFFLPTTVGGDLFRIYDTRGLSRGTGRSAVVIFIERLTGFFALLVIACCAAFFLRRWVGQVPEILVLMVLFLFGVVFLIFLFLSRATASFFQALGNLKFFPEKIRAIFLQFSEVIENFRLQPAAFLNPLLLAFLLQLNVAIYIYLIALSVNIQLPLLYFFVLVPVIQVLVMIPISVGGIGLSENIYAFFMSKLGVPVHQAVALSLLSLALRLLIGFAGAAIYNLKKF